MRIGKQLRVTQVRSQELTPSAFTGIAALSGPLVVGKSVIFIAVENDVL